MSSIISSLHGFGGIRGRLGWFDCFMLLASSASLGVTLIAYSSCKSSLLLLRSRGEESLLRPKIFACMQEASALAIFKEKMEARAQRLACVVR